MRNFSGKATMSTSSSDTSSAPNYSSCSFPSLSSHTVPFLRATLHIAIVATEIIIWTLQEPQDTELGSRGIFIPSQEWTLVPSYLLMWATPVSSSSSNIWRLDISSCLWFIGVSQTLGGKCLTPPRRLSTMLFCQSSSR